MSDDLLEECPGCNTMIDCTLGVCPHCKYDLNSGTPAKTKGKPKAQAKAPKVIEVPKPQEKDEDTNPDLEQCPGCEAMIDCTLGVCPHCRYNLNTGTPAKTRGRPSKVTEEIAQSNKGKVADAYQNLIMVPALGRISKPPIDFSQLHWKRERPVNDSTLLEWAEELRYAYPTAASDRTGMLSNHAIGYLAERANGPNDKVLRDNAKLIVELLGGDDYN